MNDTTRKFLTRYFKISVFPPERKFNFEPETNQGIFDIIIKLASVIIIFRNKLRFLINFKDEGLYRGTFRGSCLSKR